MTKIGNCELHLIDCMEYMAGLPDKAFDLAIVDPPYGIDAAELFGGDARKSGNGCAMKSAFVKKAWDTATPEREYFDQLTRVSKNQIVWGANYMTNHLPHLWVGLFGIRTTVQQNLVTVSLPTHRLIAPSENSNTHGTA